MKKKKKISLLLLTLVFTIFFIPNGVEAANTLGTCEYNVSDPSRLGLGNVKKLSFSVTVKDDGSITSKKMYVNDKSVGFDTKSFKADSFYLVGNSVKEFNNKGTFYKAFNKYGDCPNIQLIYYINTQQLGMYTDGNKDSDGNQSITVSTTKTGGTSSSSNGNSSSSGNKVYCTRKPQKVLSSGQNVTVSFEQQGKVKKIRLVSSTRSDKVFNYDEVATLDNVMFRVDSKSVSKFWSDKCSSTEMYFAAINGDKNNIIIQSTAPEDIDNASYAPSEAKYDDGGIKSNATLDGLNQKYDSCSQLIDTKTEGSFGWLLQRLLNYIKIAGPILVVLLSALDFIKAIASSEEEALKKAQSRLVIRLIAALALFLVPTFVELLLGLINGISDPTCGLK